MKGHFLLLATAICLSLASNLVGAANKPRVSSQRLAVLSQNAFGAIWIDSDLEEVDLEFEVRAALDGGLSPNARNESGETLLLQAIENQRMSIVRMLLRRGANPNLAIIDSRSAQPLGETPLMKTLLMHDSLFEQPSHREQILRWLLQRSAHPNLRDKAGNTALLLAATEGRSDAAALLLKFGADFRLRNARGQTALQIALTPIPRGSIGIMGSHWDPNAPTDAASVQRQWQEDEKRNQREARAMEQRISKGRAAIVRCLKAAGARA